MAKVDPNTGAVTSFVSNKGGGPASGSNADGEGMERPFDVKFGPEGAMYNVNYGVVTIDMTMKPLYSYKAGTGTIWKVSKVLSDFLIFIMLEMALAPLFLNGSAWDPPRMITAIVKEG